MRSYEKFESVVVNGGKASERNPDQPAQRWQALYRLYQEGALRAYFDALLPDANTVEAALRDGRFVRDERLKVALASLRTSSTSDHQRHAPSPVEDRPWRAIGDLEPR
jgi:hypothetical protein